MNKKQEIKLAKKALDLLKPIKPKNWLIGNFTNEIDSCCAIGHFLRLTSDDPNDYSDYNCSDLGFNAKAKSSLRQLSVKNWGLAGVNNTESKEFKQKTPKARVMSFLKQIINQK